MRWHQHQQNQSAPMACQRVWSWETLSSLCRNPESHCSRPCFSWPSSWSVSEATSSTGSLEERVRERTGWEEVCAEEERVALLGFVVVVCGDVRCVRIVRPQRGASSAFSMQAGGVARKCVPSNYSLMHESRLIVRSWIFCYVQNVHQEQIPPFPHTSIPTHLPHTFLFHTPPSSAFSSCPPPPPPPPPPPRPPLCPVSPSSSSLKKAAGF